MNDEQDILNLSQAITTLRVTYIDTFNMFDTLLNMNKGGNCYE